MRKNHTTYFVKGGAMYRSILLGVLVAAAGASMPAMSSPHAEEFHANLVGFNEVGELNNEDGAILTQGNGTMRP
jgi:hypothetical protein